MVPPRYWKWPPLWMRLTLGVSPAARARTAREVTMVAANFMVSGEGGLLGVLVGGWRGKAGFLAFLSADGGGRRASWRSRRRSAGEGGLLGVLVGGRRLKTAKRQSSSSEDFPLNDVSLPSSFPFYTHLRDSAVTVQRSLSPFRPKKKWAGPSWNFGWRRIGLRENSLGVPIRGIKFREFLAL